MNKPKAHARFAASSAYRWVNCPGSVKLSEMAPPQKSSAAADEGTIAHELMEFALDSGVKDVVKFFENDEKYPLEMRLHIQDFVDFVRSKMKPHFELLVEQKVHLKNLHPTDAFGTVDVAIIEPFGELHIIDLKYGKGFVDHVDNLQMTYYALGIAYAQGLDFEKVSMTIFQPRLGYGEAARTHTISMSELMAWESAFYSAISLAEQADPQKDLCEGSWCKFCPAKVICPAISTKALERAKLKFDAPVLPEPKALSLDQLKTILDRAEYLELWINDVKEYAEQFLNDGGRIEGWGLIPKRAIRRWRNAEAIQKIYGDKLTETKLMSPAEAEKILKKELNKKDLEGFFEENVVSVSSGTRLGKTDDYASRALDKFSEVN